MSYVFGDLWWQLFQPLGPCNTRSVRSNDRKMLGQYRQMQQQIVAFFLDNLFPSPTHPRLPLCKLTCSTQKMKKSAASIPHNLAHAPQPPHGHTHTRTQEIQFTKKDKCNRCHQWNTFQQPSFTFRQHFVPAIYQHTHDPCSHTHPHPPDSQWKSLLGSYQDFSHPRWWPKKNFILEVRGTGPAILTGTINATASWLQPEWIKNCKSENCQHLQLMTIFRIGGAHI